MFLSPYAKGNLTRMPALATELLRYEPAVFATGIADDPMVTLRVPAHICQDDLLINARKIRINN